jgi:hypothetical protein
MTDYKWAWELGAKTLMGSLWAELTRPLNSGPSLRFPFFIWKSVFDGLIYSGFFPVKPIPTHYKNSTKIWISFSLETIEFRNSSKIFGYLTLNYYYYLHSRKFGFQQSKIKSLTSNTMFVVTSPNKYYNTHLKIVPY